MKSIRTVPAVALALALGLVLAGGAPELDEAAAADRATASLCRCADALAGRCDDGGACAEAWRTRLHLAKSTPVSTSISLDGTRMYAFAVPTRPYVVRSADDSIMAPVHALTGSFVVRNGSRTPVTVRYGGAAELEVVVRRQADGLEVWRGTLLAEPSAATAAELERLGSLYYQATVRRDTEEILALSRRISEVREPRGAHERVWGPGETVEFRLEKAGVQVPVTHDWRSYTIEVAHTAIDPALRVDGEADFNVHTSIRRM